MPWIHFFHYWHCVLFHEGCEVAVKCFSENLVGCVLHLGYPLVFSFAGHALNLAKYIEMFALNKYFASDGFWQLRLLVYLTVWGIWLPMDTRRKCGGSSLLHVADLKSWQKVWLWWVIIMGVAISLGWTVSQCPWGSNCQGLLAPNFIIVFVTTPNIHFFFV